MVFIQNAPRLGNINRRFLGQAPGQLDQPIKIGAHHAIFGRGVWHSLQPPQLLAGLVLDLFWHIRLSDRLAELGYLLGLARLALTELALDRRHLLAKQNLALTLVEGRLGLAADLLRQSQDFDAVCK